MGFAEGDGGGGGGCGVRVDEAAGGSGGWVWEVEARLREAGAGKGGPWTKEADGAIAGVVRAVRGEVKEEERAAPVEVPGAGGSAQRGRSQRSGCRGTWGGCCYSMRTLRGLRSAPYDCSEASEVDTPSENQPPRFELGGHDQVFKLRLARSRIPILVFHRPRNRASYHCCRMAGNKSPERRTLSCLGARQQVGSMARRQSTR